MLWRDERPSSVTPVFEVNSVGGTVILFLYIENFLCKLPLPVRILYRREATLSSLFSLKVTKSLIEFDTFFIIFL